MKDKHNRRRRPAYLPLLGVFVLTVFLVSCGRGEQPVKSASGGQVESTGQGMTLDQHAQVMDDLAEGETSLSAAELADYAMDVSLTYDAGTKKLCFSLDMPLLPASDDAYVYLFAAQSWEDDTDALLKEPVTRARKDRVWETAFPYRETHLFSRFVPALRIDGNFVPMGKSVYLSNPEALAENRDAYPDPGSKKGLLLDPTMIGDPELTELGVKHTIYNIPLSHIMGETADPTFPTITYTYRGKNYQFNGAAINGYDGLFTYLSDMGMSATAVVLNDWNEEYLELIHPEARKQADGAYYYMFNTAEENGARTLEAVASFLAERYSSGEHGMIHSWVIANEINQKRVWNYMDTQDVVHYAETFERSLRIFYQAVKSHYAAGRVYFSIDHAWNSNEGDNRNFFNGRDVLEAFNTAALAHGNYDWGIAIHPYPEPLTRVNFWSQEYDKTRDTSHLSVMNLNVLTDMLSEDAFLQRDGDVRSITITELGFSSGSGERLQAAAFAYCYYIVEANPYVDAFLMSRQTDAPEEVRAGLSFGIYEYDHTGKYMKDVFRDIDTDRAGEHMDFMLKILGADSLEEALSWAAADAGNQ
ncbi:MAG: DUF5722 domain-containing protein [Bacteroidales bacterium]|nr:DUF5722 domain-containing protein [Bacteroidales bacterium]MCM1416249.1 DUF5722 domain-containing protein [bacterium]MCM1423133.1 DUF5722 domain-containing protein [bacterium]